MSSDVWCQEASLGGLDISDLLRMQGEIFAAEGYGKVTGEVGVCIATSGPGATNLVTGLADALLDSVPMVAITGQVRRLPANAEASLRSLWHDGCHLRCVQCKNKFRATSATDCPGL